MGDILIKAFSFVLIIIIGYAFKRRGIFGPRDYKIITRIIMNITLPCALITGFKGFKMEYLKIEMLYLRRSRALDVLLAHN